MNTKQPVSSDLSTAARLRLLFLFRIPDPIQFMWFAMNWQKLLNEKLERDI